MTFARTSFYLGKNGKVEDSRFPILTSTTYKVRNPVFISDDPPTFLCMSNWLEMWQLNEHHREWQKTDLTPPLGSHRFDGAINRTSDGGVWAAVVIDKKWTLCRFDKRNHSVQTFKTSFTVDTTYDLQVVDAKGGNVDLIFWQPSFPSMTVEQVLNSPEMRKAGKSKVDLFFQRLDLSTARENKIKGK